MRIAENSTMLREAGKAKHKTPAVLLIFLFPAVFILAYLSSTLISYIPLAVMLRPSGGVKFFFPLMAELMRHPPYWFGVLSSILPFVLIILFIIFYCLRIERRSLASMGLRKAGIPANYLVGYAVGTLMITAAVGLSVLLGGETFTGFNAGVSAPYIALMFAHYLVQGMSEEVAFRGYLMVSCANRVPAAAAVAISSLIFAAFHLFNGGVTVLAFINLTLYGAFAAFYVLRTDDLWGACAVHSAWNFFQGNIFGISVSGGDALSSVFGTLPVIGRENISGGGFGIEGGLCTTLVMAFGIALLLIIPRKPRPAFPADGSDKTV